MCLWVVAYTLAIIVAEALETKQFLGRVKIYATDMAQEAIEQARVGIYSSRNITDIPGMLVTKYFDS